MKGRIDLLNGGKPASTISSRSASNHFSLAVSLLVHAVENTR